MSKDKAMTNTCWARETRDMLARCPAARAARVEPVRAAGAAGGSPMLWLDDPMPCPIIPVDRMAMLALQARALGFITDHAVPGVAASENGKD